MTAVTSSFCAWTNCNISGGAYQRGEGCDKCARAAAAPSQRKLRAPKKGASQPRCDHQPRPSRQKTEPAQRRDRAQPADVGERHRVKAAAEKNDPGGEKKVRNTIS